MHRQARVGIFTPNLTDYMALYIYHVNAYSWDYTYESIPHRYIHRLAKPPKIVLAERQINRQLPYCTLHESRLYAVCGSAKANSDGTLLLADGRDVTLIAANDFGSAWGSSSVIAGCRG